MQRSVEVVLNTVEKKAVNASGGVGVQPGEGLASVLGSATFSHNNLFGCGQSLDFAVDAGQVCFLETEVSGWLHLGAAKQVSGLGYMLWGSVQGLGL